MGRIGHGRWSNQAGQRCSAKGGQQRSTAGAAAAAEGSVPKARQRGATCLNRQLHPPAGGAAANQAQRLCRLHASRHSRRRKALQMILITIVDAHTTHCKGTPHTVREHSYQSGREWQQFKLQALTLSAGLAWRSLLCSSACSNTCLSACVACTSSSQGLCHAAGGGDSGGQEADLPVD